MLMPSQGMRILVATKPVDFRKGHDGLAALAQSMLAEDPFTGTIFVFRSKRADRLKILFWDGSGLVLYWKRTAENDRPHVPNRIAIKFLTITSSGNPKASRFRMT